MHRFHAVAFPSLLLCAHLVGQSIDYELRIANPKEQKAEVTARFPVHGASVLELFLPVWSPGFYRIEDYAANVADFAAATGDGTALAVEHAKANRWRITTQGADAVVVHYALRCNAASVTRNQIADGFAVFCGPATFIGEVGHLGDPCTVQVELPAGWPSVATGLAPAADGKSGHFAALDYDRLLDSPIVLGAITTTSFDVLGARHEWAAFGAPGDWDAALATKKLQPVAAELCRTFGTVPFDRYVFLAGFRHANGGLEHLDSTLLSLSRGMRPDDPGFLSFVAHEYAHAFNVKRLRPVELGPFDYENPPHTPSLWISEGLTTWYGDLALVRAGVIDAAAWLSLVSEHVRGLQGSPGRKLQTLADASLSVWNSSMSGAGGDPRKTISYYVKGPVVGLLLEARLRTATDGRFGLDEVMRRAYAQYSGASGFRPEQFEAIATAVAGSDQTAFFDRALRSCEELDYTELLACFGLRFREVAAEAPRQQRWSLEVSPDATPAQKERFAALLMPTPESTLRGAGPADRHR